jgi:hypothetical protein
MPLTIRPRPVGDDGRTPHSEEKPVKRTLTLRREALSDLTPADLAAVGGGDATVGDHCGPPFDTEFLPVVVSLLLSPATTCNPLQ